MGCVRTVKVGVVLSRALWFPGCPCAMHSDAAGCGMLPLIRILGACAFVWLALGLTVAALWVHGIGTAVLTWVTMQGLAGLLMPDMPDDGG